MDSEDEPFEWQLLSRAKSLIEKFEQGGGISCINEAIDLDREALQLCPPVHPDRAAALNCLVVRLYYRYDQLRSMRDLDEAIALGREALDLCPRGHLLRCTSLNNLANRLSDRQNRLGSIQDLDEAVLLGREALDLCPSGHFERSTSLINLANHLGRRYNEFGSVKDLNEAIVFTREALDLRPPGHSLRSVPLNNLANNLCDRYTQLGSMQDLEEAIVLGREALLLRPAGHSLRPTSLNNLAEHLFHRYSELGSTQDLDEAIILTREALDLRPSGHAAITALDNLAKFLSSRYDQLKSMQDLNEVIVLIREILFIYTPGHPQRPTSLNNLVSHFIYRYNELGSMQDLDEAIVLAREALDLHPLGHYLRPTSLNNLVSCLSHRVRKLGLIQDMDEAIALARDALDLCPEGHPYRSQSLDNLARSLFDRFTQSGKSADKEEMFGLYIQLAYTDQFFVSSFGLSAAGAWVRMAEHFQHPMLRLAYETRLQLLTHHLATLPSLSQRLGILGKHTSLATDAFSACLRRRAPARAIELLEQGQSMFWDQLTRLRSPLDDVRESGPEGIRLADEFAHLALLIRNGVHLPFIREHERIHRFTDEMQEVVAHIRELPGLSRFLLPSLFSDLRRAAIGGPVIVVNESQYSCDALIIFLDRDPVHVPLPITHEHVRDLATELRTLMVRATKADTTTEFACFLRTLWDRVVLPIVDVLQTTVPCQSRIWWCPTGVFSGLPLHAAGPFRKGHRNLPALYISSYTPTLTALVRAWRDGPSDSTADRKRFVVISQANVAGESELLSVAEELDAIGHRDDGSPAASTHADSENARVSRVVAALGENEWVRLACHGLPNHKRPFASAFARHDGYLTIQEVVKREWKDTEFAYLSACHATVVLDEERPDEVIHLASAMQFIGFRSVIGTMGPVDDGEAKKIMSTVYKCMMDGSGRLDVTLAAFALNETMKSVDIPLDQRVLYTHVGV